jgi:hypothetical protein
MASTPRQTSTARTLSGPNPVVKPSLLFVGSQKGGVGKTTIARLILHWLEENRRSHVAFDTEVPFGSLIRFYREKTELADIDQVAAQMRIFDAAYNDQSGSVFVVDLRAGYLYRILDLLGDLRMLRDAQDGAFNIVFLHIMSGSLESIREITETVDRFSGAKHIVVTNPANGLDLLDWEASEARVNFERDGGIELNMPELNKLAYNEIDRSGATFGQFINNRQPNGVEANYSYVLRGYTRDWVLKSMAQIDRINL